MVPVSYIARSVTIPWVAGEINGSPNLYDGFADTGATEDCSGSTRRPVTLVVVLISATRLGGLAVRSRLEFGHGLTSGEIETCS